MEEKKNKNLKIALSALLVFLATAALCICSLSLAYGPTYPDGVFAGYFKNPLIVPLNYLPILAAFLILYGIIGRSWIAYLIECAVVFFGTAANYWLLKFRDDPLMFKDIFHYREAARIASEGYKYEISLGMWICFFICAVFAVILALFVKQKIKPSWRICTVIAVLVVSLAMKEVYFSKAIYDKYTDNYEHVTQWSPTQKYVAKGFLYPFIYSAKDAFSLKPDGYNEAEIKQLLSQYETKDETAPKVDVITVMLEAYCDVGNLGIEDVDESVYELYRRLKEENYSGTLVTNIFAAGTIDSERAFLTGYPVIDDYRRNVNSYVRYLASMGYTADGSHPSENWFYNRVNTNKYIGFDNYRFAENYFIEKYGDVMRSDSVVFDDFYENYLGHINSSDEPYFGFHVTYQGHAPYDTNIKLWGTEESPLYTGENVSFETDCILNNYLGTVKDTGWRMWQFVEKIKAQERPCVVLLFGDHKPWLGDGNSVYDELGINIDVSTKEGFLNYYSTEYVIVANDAAKALLEDEFSGEGPTVSPCFLMNVLFDKLGYKGNAYMNYTDAVMEEIPVVNSVGIMDKDGNFYLTENMPSDILEVYNNFKGAAYYVGTHYED